MKKTLSNVTVEQLRANAKKINQLAKIIEIINFHYIKGVEFDEGLNDGDIDDLAVCVLTAVQEAWDTYIQTHVLEESHGAGEVDWDWETLEPDEETKNETGIETVFTSNQQMLKIYYQNVERG